MRVHWRRPCGWELLEAYRSLDWPLADIQQGTGELSHTTARKYIFSNSLCELWSEFFSVKPPDENAAQPTS